MTIDYSIKVTQCEPMPGYKLKVTCSDGATGIFDMSRYIDRGMFKPLKDPQTFDRVRLAFGVPSWPGDFFREAFSFPALQVSKPIAVSTRNDWRKTPAFPSRP